MTWGQLEDFIVLIFTILELIRLLLVLVAAHRFSNCGLRGQWWHTGLVALQRVGS